MAAAGRPASCHAGRENLTASPREKHAAKPTIHSATHPAARRAAPSAFSREYPSHAASPRPNMAMALCPSASHKYDDAIPAPKQNSGARLAAVRHLIIRAKIATDQTAHAVAGPFAASAK